MTTDLAVRPIKAGERQALTRLIKNDFESLVSELETLKLDALHQAQQEFSALFQASLPARHEYMDKVNTQIDVITKEIRNLELQAQEDGYELSYSGYRSSSHRVTSVTDTKIQREYDKRKQEIEYQYRKAIELLRRKRLDTERGLLLAAITSEEAQEFMNALPTAKSLFEQAAINES
jgi:hypothetical protein